MYYDADERKWDRTNVCRSKVVNSHIWKLKDWKEKIFPMIDWHFANRRWRNHNGKYSNSYGGS